MRRNKEKYSLHRNGWGNVSIDEYIEAMTEKLTYGGEPELAAYQYISRKPVCVLPDSVEGGTYPGDVDFSTHAGNTVYFKLSGRHYEALIWKGGKNIFLTNSSIPDSRKGASLYEDIYENVDGFEVNEDNVDPILEVQMSKIKRRRGENEKEEQIKVCRKILRETEEEDQKDVGKQEILKNEEKEKKKVFGKGMKENEKDKQKEISRKEVLEKDMREEGEERTKSRKLKRFNVEDQKQRKITDLLPRMCEKTSSSSSPQQNRKNFITPISSSQKSMYSFLKSPPKHFFEEFFSQNKESKKPRLPISKQFLQYSKPKIKEEKAEIEDDELYDDVNLSESNIGFEKLSEEPISKQFSPTTSLKTDSLYEQLVKKKITHYTFLTTTPLNSIAQNYMGSMVSTLYAPRFKVESIDKAIRKVKEFWISVITTDEMKSFLQSPYSFFFSRRSVAINTYEELADEISAQEKEEVEADIIMNDFGCRMNSCVISEASVERLFSEVSRMMSIQQLSLNDETLLGLINIKHEH
jgi:hypothetical protein